MVAPVQFILDRVDKFGSFGMCIQYANFFNGLCMAYGTQGRLVNILGHEIPEVWSDDFGKWVYLDPTVENHYLYNPETGQPANMLDLHNIYIDYFFPDKPIDWMTDMLEKSHRVKLMDKRKDKPCGSAIHTNTNQTKAAACRRPACVGWHTEKHQYGGNQAKQHDP